MGSDGDGGPAVEAQLNRPLAMTVDAEGNVFIGEYSGYRVRKGRPRRNHHNDRRQWNQGWGRGWSPATAAQFNYISGLAIDALGNVLVSDMNEARIRTISPAGRITTIAGTGRQGHSGHWGPAAKAEIETPEVSHSIPQGNLFLAEYWAGRLRKIDSAGIIQTIAGTGEQLSTGDMGLAIDAALDRPIRIAADSDGNLYVSEGYADRVRILRPTAELWRFSVPLGTSGESVLLTAANDGSLRWNSFPLMQGMETTASNGNRYAFGQTASGLIVASYIPERQTVELQEDKSVTLMTAEGRCLAHRRSGCNEWVPPYRGWHRVPAGMDRRAVEAGQVHHPNDCGHGRRCRGGSCDYGQTLSSLRCGGGFRWQRICVRFLQPTVYARLTRRASSQQLRGQEKGATTGDGGPATQAEFDTPKGIAINWLGEIFVADSETMWYARSTGREELPQSTPIDRYLIPFGLALDVFGNVLVAEISSSKSLGATDRLSWKSHSHRRCRGTARRLQRGRLGSRG